MSLKMYSLKKSIFKSLLFVFILVLILYVALILVKQKQLINQKASSYIDCSQMVTGSTKNIIGAYAKSLNFNIGGLINECFNQNNPNSNLCKQTATTEYAGMFVPYQDAWRTTEKEGSGINDFTKFNEAIAFARKNNMKLHFYHLIWTSGKDNSYTPAWLFTKNNCGPNDTDGDCDTDHICGKWTRPELLEIMKTHIQTTMRHGGNTVAVWNVVNEAFSSNGETGNYCFLKIIGKDYVDKAFEYAHEVAPNAILVLNEAFGRGRMEANEIEAFFNYVKSAKSRGIPIDAVGLQNHLLSETGEQFSEGYLQDLDNYFKKAQDANVKVLITEMDVYQAGRSQEEVAKLYKNIASKCLSYKNCISLGTWGISDEYSWARNSNYANLPDAEPLLFDKSYQRKPAYYGVMEAFRERLCIDKPTPSPAPKLVTCNNIKIKEECISSCGNRPEDTTTYNCAWFEKENKCIQSINICTRCSTHTDKKTCESSCGKIHNNKLRYYCHWSGTAQGCVEGNSTSCGK